LYGVLVQHHALDQVGPLGHHGQGAQEPEGATHGCETLELTDITLDIGTGLLGYILRKKAMGWVKGLVEHHPLDQVGPLGHHRQGAQKPFATYGLECLK
jgi:hypothetical protein